jgi:hypothetical protein
MNHFIIRMQIYPFLWGLSATDRQNLNYGSIVCNPYFNTAHFPERFLAKNKFVLENSTYLSDLVLYDFFMCLKLRIPLKSLIINHLKTLELCADGTKMTQKNDFQQCFQAQQGFWN